MRRLFTAVLLFLLVVGACSVFPFGAAAQGEEDFALTILHTNDVHARVEQFTKYGSTCGDQDAADGNCFGGVSRRVTELAKVRAEGGNSVLVDAGDQFQGTLFFIEYKGEEAPPFLNQMGYQAMAVGNHEFDDGPAVLADFINAVDFPVLSANIDASQDPDLAGMIKPYTILEAGGEQIGVIGCTTAETPLSSSPGPTIVFNDVQNAVEASVLELEAQGIDKILVLSHIGYLADQDLAAAVDGIDVIVGGHSHTLLSNTVQDAAGPYPTVVDSPSGNPVLVVQDGAWGMYLGRLDVTFDDQGVPAEWQGDPILLDASVAEDADTLAEVDKLDAPLETLREKVIGQAAVTLDGERTTCRYEECSLGDLITDAMIEATQSEGTEIAILNGGSIRTSIPAGDVSWGAVLEVLPFGNTIATFELQGAEVWQALENGVSRAESTENEGTGRFAQVSGLRFTWNPNLPAGSRVVSVDVRQTDGSFQPIDPNGTYKVASNAFTRGGGDGYSVFAEKAENAYDFGPVLADAVAAYVTQHSPISLQVEGRITRDEGAVPPSTLPIAGAAPSAIPWIVFLFGVAVLVVGLKARQISG